MFRFFTVIVTFRPQGMPHNHIKIFLFPWIMLDTIKILLFLPFQKKTITLPPCVVLHLSFCPQSSPTLNLPAIPHGNAPAKPSLLPLHAPKEKKKKKISQYLHVLPVIYDGGFSKWLAPRYVLLSLAMLWNQLNYITT